MSVNLWIGIGNMTDDPDRRYTPNNIQITSFGIAVNKPGRRDDREEKPLYVDVDCWDKLAEQVYDNGRKGRKVYIQGELVREEWDDKDSGKKRYKYLVKAFIVRWLDSNPNRDDRDDDRGRGRGRDDDRDRGRGRDDRPRRDDRDDDRDRGRSRPRDEEPRSRSNARDDDAPLPTDNRDAHTRDRDDRDLPF